MKRAAFLLGFGVLFLAAIAFAVTESDSVFAQSGTQASPGGDPNAPWAREVTQAEKEAGLWNEGKAVFSDLKPLDILWPEKYSRGYTPAQPIEYNHRVHVVKSQIECQYCHSGVAKSPYATIPSVELCMGCHKLVKTDSEEIKKLKRAFDEKKPVEWVPVHNLPEHVHFTHERHIKAGVGCQNCHGQVQKMDRVERVSSMKMGFCVSCHRDKGAPIDCVTCHY